MQFRFSFIAVLGLVIFSTLNFLNAQELIEPRRICGTKAPSAEWDVWFNARVEAYKQTAAYQRGLPVTITIPVVVHVIHGNESVATYPNLSSSQIKSQIKILNDDFAGRGYNSGNIAVTGFSTVGIANTNITFCLAQFDPNGNLLTEPGIDRVNYNTMGWQNPNVPGSSQNFTNYMDNTVKPATIWDPTNYFNIWVSDVNPSAYLLGYATFPAGTNLAGLNSNFGNAGNDGIWIWAKAFGSVGTLDPVYNKGRTAVHEAGHWLGLRHIGGDANNAAGDCNATDYCNDTPSQKGGFGSGSFGQNFGAPVYPLHVNVCGSQYGDMFMNFMDYCDDQVLYMFTPDQNVRIQTAMLDGVFRNQLNASSATQCAGLPAVDFAESQPSCLEEGNTPVYLTSGTVSTYTWISDPATGVVFTPNANVANPQISYPSAGLYTISVIVTNTAGTSTSQYVSDVNTCLGIGAAGKQAGVLGLQPNPAQDKVVIRFSPDHAGTAIEIKVLNTLGEQIMAQTFDNEAKGSYELPLSSLNNGIYFVILSNGESSAGGRLVVAR